MYQSNAKLILFWYVMLMCIYIFVNVGSVHSNQP